MCYLKLDPNTARVLLSKRARQLQQCLAQPLLAIYRYQIGDDLLLVCDAHCEIAHESLP